MSGGSPFDASAHTSVTSGSPKGRTPNEMHPSRICRCVEMQNTVRACTCTCVHVFVSNSHKAGSGNSWGARPDPIPTSEGADSPLTTRNLEYCWDGGLRIRSVSGGPSIAKPRKATRIIIIIMIIIIIIVVVVVVALLIQLLPLLLLVVLALLVLCPKERCAKGADRRALERWPLPHSRFLRLAMPRQRRGKVYHTRNRHLRNRRGF